MKHHLANARSKAGVATTAQLVQGYDIGPGILLPLLGAILALLGLEASAFWRSVR